MHRILFQVLSTLFIISLFIGCSSTIQSTESAQDLPDWSTDTTAIRATLEGWYDAMYIVDSAAIMAPLTSEFLLLEGTLPLSGSELIARLQKGDPETKWSAEFSDFRSRIVDDVAWTTVKNHEDATMKDRSECTADFLETIVFILNGTGWLIDRYHAAEVNPWECEETL